MRGGQIRAAKVDMETVAECPLCRASLAAARPTWLVAGWSIVSCPRCKAGVTTPRPTLDEIGAFYRPSFFLVRPDAKLFPTFHTILRRQLKPALGMTTIRSIVLNEIKYRHDWTLQGGALRPRLLAPLRWLLALAYEPVQALPGRPGAVLDIGFGRGEFLLRAKRLGWQCHGVEVSATSVDWGRELGFQVQQFDGSFSRPLDYPDATFDLISANSVLEHVHHPRRLVEESRRLLKRGGKILIMVPNYECQDTRLLGEHWRMWSPPQHLFHFTAGNVRSLLQEHGFHDIKVRYKLWFNPITEKLSLKSLRPTVTRARYRQIAWQLRVGKRLDFLRGRLAAAQVAPGMAIEAVKD